MKGCPLIALFVVTIGSGFASAATIFYDDFSDGSVTNDVPLKRDGNPVIWNSSYGAMLTVEEGDMIVRATNQDWGSAILGLTDEDWVVFSDGYSLRTQFRLAEGDSIGVTLNALLFMTYVRLGSDGALSLRSKGGYGPPKDKMVVNTDLDVTREDVIIQVDGTANGLAVRVWRAGEAMPLEPLIEGEIWPNEGPFLLEVGDNRLLPYREGIFRYVYVADGVIPEPSACLLACIVLLAACSGRK